MINTAAPHVGLEVLRQELSPWFAKGDLVPLPRGAVVRLHRRCPFARRRGLAPFRPGLLADAADVARRKEMSL